MTAIQFPTHTVACSVKFDVLETTLLRVSFISYSAFVFKPRISSLLAYVLAHENMYGSLLILQNVVYCWLNEYKQDIAHFLALSVEFCAV